MEEKYDQIKMNIETPLPSDDGEGDKAFSHTESAPEQKSAPRAPRSAPLENMKIDGEIFSAEQELDDDIELVSPNEEIFKRVTGQLENSRTADDVIGWAHESEEKDDGENIKLDDTYASTSQTDHQFMVAFGIGDSQDRTLNIDEGSNQPTADIETMQGDIRSDYYEYTDRQQRKEIIGMYKYAKRNMKTKIIMASFFTFFILLIENLGIFGGNLTGILNIAEHPYVHFFADFLFFGLCIACAYEQMYHGARSIFSRNYIPESVAVVAAAIGVIYSLITLICISFEVTPRLCNLPAAFIVLGSIIFSYINVVREKYGFSVVSSKDTKFILTSVPKGESEPEQETFSTTSCDFNGNIARVDKVGFVKNYFTNTNSVVDIHKYLEVCFAFSMLVPAVFAVISLFRSFGFYNSLSVWYTGVLLMLPVGILFMYSFPFFLGNKRLFDDEVSIIGEEAVEEFAKADIISVNDTTAFPPYNVKLQNLNVYNDYKLEKVLYYAASGFSVVGGPLSDVFDVATKDAMSKSQRAKYVCSGRSYLCVKVDNDTIIFADRYGMSSQGIEVGPEKEESDDVSVMYMACNGKLCARMYIRYKIDEEFVKTVKYLSKTSTGVGIRTFDPNINNEIIKRQTNFKKDDLRVIKLTSEEDIPRTVEKSDGKIVSKGVSRSLLKAIPVCKRIVGIRKVIKAIKCIAAVLGASLIGLLVFGKIPFMASGMILALYLIGVVILTLTSLIMLPKTNG